MQTTRVPFALGLSGIACAAAAATLACSSSSSSAKGTALGPDASATASDASGDGPAPEAGPDGAVSYPPLRFASIGKPTKISDAFYFTEGPVWDPAKGVLYFTDINGDPPAADADGAPPEASAGDAGGGGTVLPGGVVYELTPPSSISVLFEPAGNADGLGLDPQGNLLGAGFFSRDVWRRSAAGTLDTLGSCSSEGGVPGTGGSCFMGMPINTPDDVTSRSDGILYFTDPTFASGSQGFPALDLPLTGAQGVYRITADGVLHLEDSSTSGPNGVNLSPDEKTMYVSYTLTGEVAKFDVAADGSLSNKTTFATGATVADSMCVDAGGNVYVGTVTGLGIYDPTGTHLGTLSVDGNVVTNCAFGGADQKTLFITARTTATLSGAPPLGGGLLYEVTAMPVPGMPGRN